MSGKKLRNKKRKRKRTVARSAVRFVVLLILLMFTAAAAFLQVEEITVSGNYHESEEEVRTAVLERAPGRSILLAYLLNNGRRPLSLPFVEKFNVSFGDAKTLEVAVKEKPAVGCMNAQDAWWYFDGEGKLLFSLAVPEVKNEGHFIPLLEGVPLPKKDDGGEKVLSSGMSLGVRKSFFSDIGAVQMWCGSQGVYPDLISFDESENMTLIFGGLAVQMGSFGNVPMKLAVLTGLMPEILGRSGTLDLKNYDGTQKDIYFF